MRWKRVGPSSQIEDRRGRGGGGRGGFPMGRGFPMGGGRRGGGRMAGGGLGLLGLVIALLLGGNALGGGGGGGGFGIDPGTGGFGAMGSPEGGRGLDGAPDPDAELKEFVTFVVEDVQASWQEQFAAAGQRYEVTTLVLFEEGVDTDGCGSATSATGPFYCPADSKVYLDLGFFRELATRFGAPGDFAQAYVVAHEFGHHVQNVLGVNDQVRRAQQRRPDDANELSVRMELQADCFAGVWANSAYEENLLEEGDLEEGLNAAAAVGDDRIQEAATGRVNPETFTHGTSAQRREWFEKGYRSGSPDSCDTFS